MKKCSICEKNLPFENFGVKRINKNGTPLYRSICSNCNKEYQKSHYKNNKSTYIKKAREWEKEYKKNAYAVLMDKAKNGCFYCGEKDFRCLEFNHLDVKSKLYNISNMISNKMSIEKIKEEIEKCEVVCANCHKKITAEQFNWYGFLKKE